MGRRTLGRPLNSTPVDTASTHVSTGFLVQRIQDISPVRRNANQRLNILKGNRSSIRQNSFATTFMKLQPQHRLSIILALFVGFGAVLGICQLYQSVSSKPEFPIDKHTLTMTRIDRLENPES